MKILIAVLALAGSVAVLVHDLTARAIHYL